MHKNNCRNNTTLSVLLYNDILQYWISFFLKDEKENKNHSIHLTSEECLDLYNIKLNNNTFYGLAKFDKYACPYFCANNICIRNNHNSEYFGLFRKRELTGYGKIKSKGVLLYKGYIYKGKKNKVGKYIFRNKKSSKIIYKGSWKNNKRHGYGQIKLYNNNKKKKKNKYIYLYKGYFKYNQRYFYGIQFFKDSSYYIGFWKKNKKWGYGKMTWIIKKKYQINHKINYNNFNHKKIMDNQNNKTKNINNNIYSYKNDNNLYNKKKSFFFIHSIYIGQWKNDKQEGYGKFFWFKKRKKKKKKNIKKNININKKKNNIKSMEEYININTYNYKDIYRNNIIYHTDSYNSYEGYWIKGKRFGYGIFNYYNGKKYIGMWKNNKKDGYGYLININNIINICFYKQNKLIYEFSINKIYQINNLYNNTLCNVINLSFFKKYYNLKNKKLQNLYKIIYDNFTFLIDIYNFYKDKKKKYIKSNTTIYNNMYHNSFTLQNLWSMFFNSYIFDMNFFRYNLDNLVIDNLSYIDQREKNYFLEKSEQPTEHISPFLYNERDFIKKLFTPFDYLKNISTNKNGHTKENINEDINEYVGRESETLIHKDNITTMNTPNNVSIDNNTSNTNIICHSCKNIKTHLLSSNNEIQSMYSPYYFSSPYQYFIFNMDLCLLKDCTDFYKYHWKHSFYKQANYILLKNILFFIVKNNNIQKENIYFFLYYVLSSMLITTIPLYYPLIDILCKYEDDKKRFKDYNLYKYLFVHMNYKQCHHNNIHFMSHMKKITDYIFLRKYFIHDEKRIITFNSFILTLVHIDIRIGDHNKCEHKNLYHLIQFLKEHSTWKKDKQNDKQNDKKNDKKDIIQQIKNKRNFHFSTFRYIINKKKYYNNKTSYHYKEKEIDGITYIININKNNKINKKNKKNTTNVKKYKHLKNNNINNIHIWNHFFPIYYHNNILYKFCPKNKKNNTKNNAKKNGKKNCKFCLKRIKFYLKNENLYDQELRNILENFVYYYIFFFLIFKKNEKKNISIFSMKLNLSIKLKNILKFLFHLNIITKYYNKYKMNCVNLSSLKKKKYTTKIKYNHIYNNPSYDIIFQRDTHENNKNTKILSSSLVLNVEDNNNIEIEKEQIILNNKGKIYNEHIDNTCHINDYKCEEINRSPINTYEKNDHNIYTIKKKHSTNTNYFNHKVVKIIQKISGQFCLSFFEVLSMFSKILIPQRIHLIKEPLIEIYLKRLKTKKKLMKIRKIQKFVIKNNILHYYMILKKEKKKYTNQYYKCTNKKYICYNNKMVLNKLINILNEKEKELFSHQINEQHSTLQNESQNVKKQIIPSTHDDMSSIKKKKKKKEKNTVTNINNSNVNKQINPNDIHNKDTYNKLKTNKNLNANLLYLPKNQYMKSPIYCFRKYVFSHKNYMNILDFYNIYVTPYEFITFFLKFVQKIKKKKKIQAPYNEVLFFFIFHVLIYKSFQLIKKNKKKYNVND
ncbi:conserved Plasmodium protein, unknown function [Plasmodium sp. gorilla clade G2]|uniref:conserved Plasmodium protein, unknown function n=1 Tax=Plasmodium sp. gorilla clade G2 TaxID=880535 RepID=UPI000D22B596|nr:conserved Plasmodium protein, unknown function [Plasmodium sp. gorilla clade G2]SOV11681.1 conserved Plasmodium protein, unknown function [Plasmodium sp. gorilla clade G2]